MQRLLVLYSNNNGEQLARTIEVHADVDWQEPTVIQDNIIDRLPDVNTAGGFYVLELEGDNRPLVLDADGDEVAMDFDTI